MKVILIVSILLCLTGGVTWANEDAVTDPTPFRTADHLHFHDRSGDILRATLNLKISARNLRNKDRGRFRSGVSDPYVKLTLLQESFGVSTTTDIGKTSTINDNLNPDFQEEFHIDFERKANRTLQLIFKDDDGWFNPPDYIGTALINLNDYVDNGEILQADLLDTEGHCIVYSGDAINVTSTVPPVFLDLPTTLKFKISASHLTSRNAAEVDPMPHAYVIVYTIDTDKVGSLDWTPHKKPLVYSSVVEDDAFPDWEEVFEYAYDPHRIDKQTLLFEVRDTNQFYDTYQNRRDPHEVGHAFLDVDYYVQQRQDVRLTLVKNGKTTGSLRIQYAS